MTVSAQREVCQRHEMTNPAGMKVFTVEKYKLLEDLVYFRTRCGVQSSSPLVFAPNRAPDCYPLLSSYRSRQGEKPCVSELRRSELSAQVRQERSWNFCGHAQGKESRVRSGRNGLVCVEDGRGRRPREFADRIWTKASLSRSNAIHSRHTKPPSSRNCRKRRMWELGRYCRWN